MGKKPHSRNGAGQSAKGSFSQVAKAPSASVALAKSEPGGSPKQDLLTMEEAIDQLKTTRPSFYRWLREGKIKGFKIGRQWRFERQDIERFLQGLGPRIDLPVSPAPLVRQLEAKLAAVGKRVEAGRFPDDPVADAVYLMIALAYHQRASDIHITPQYESGAWSAVMRTRIDGVLHVQAQADIRLLPALMERWKSLAAMSGLDKNMPQDGRMTVMVEGTEADLRTSILPAQGGEALTVRLLLRLQDLLTFDLNKFGFDPADLKRIIEAVHAPHGVIVCNGPSGSGKTTTLYACLSMLAGPEIKTLSVEDPVEYILPWVTQVSANFQVGLGFARAVRAFLRSDPDVIMVGEIRDLEVLETCIQAAMTGHLVMTQLHATDSASALRRMVEIGCKPFMVSDGVRLVISQRLIRRLCTKCSKPVTLSAEEEAMVAEGAVSGGLALATLPREFRQPVGCPECAGTGYRGRAVVAETLKISGAIAKALRDEANVDDLRRLAISEGMTTMRADGIRKAAHGFTSLREVQWVCGAVWEGK